MPDAGFGNISIEQRRYLGAKTKLLGFIEDILRKEKVEYKVFADIFRLLSFLLMEDFL